jgi:hypothetical protein
MPVERLKLTGVEERVCFDRPMGFTRDMRDEARAWVPQEIFASNVSPPPKTFLILLVALWEATMNY